MQQKDATKAAASTQRPTLGGFKCVCAFCALPRVITLYTVAALVGELETASGICEGSTSASWWSDHNGYMVATIVVNSLTIGIPDSWWSEYNACSASIVVNSLTFHSFNNRVQQRVQQKDATKGCHHFPQLQQ